MGNDKDFICQKEAFFQSEARLLEELGERLVASSDIAIVELIKNSYDADAHLCEVKFDKNQKYMNIRDTGHGINETEFLEKWMRIATGSKQEEKLSRNYKRKMTGAKGIGRFAARFLGDQLTLESVAYDNERNVKTLLIVEFNWLHFSKSEDINQIKITYKLFKMPDGAEPGTTLKIEKLHPVKNWDSFRKKINTEVLRIISPLQGLDLKRFKRKKKGSSQDPGFVVNFIGETDKENIIKENLAENVLKNYWARLVIDLEKGTLNYYIYIQGKEKPVLSHKQQYDSNIINGLVADIRFFPRRAGIFSKKEVDGKKAWKWIHENCGVAVIDHGFRIKPYGFGDDDWLKISQDTARSERDWRSNIMKSNKKFEMEPEIYSAPSRNPMLNLPNFHQLVGGVFVESGTGGNSDLIPSMDRQGYLENEAYVDLFEIVRAGSEMLALSDKNEKEKILEKEARLATEKARKDIKTAIKQIAKLPSLTDADRNRLIKEFSFLAKNIEEKDKYDRKAREGLETISLLGVVAAFMTHESKRILSNLEKVLKKLKELSAKHKEIAKPLGEIQQSYEEFLGYLDYTSTYVKSVNLAERFTFKSLPQIERIISKFGRVIKESKIEIIKDIDRELETPPLPVAIYSGVILNLYTNAVKAIISGTKDNKEPQLLFRAWNEKRKHIVEVSDNGIGIPPALKERIWDPLFTTTSNLNNPFGSGMGLGLSLVKKAVNSVGGTIELVEPSSKGFSTCFRVEFRFPK